MLYNELELPPGVRAAIKQLEDAGMVVVTEARLEDCRKSDGSRFRTFTLSGRHDLALICRKVDDLNEISSAGEVTESSNEEENFWLDRNRWIRMGSSEFCLMVLEECLGDLLDAPKKVQVDVKSKFDRLCDPDDWPLEL